MLFILPPQGEVYIEARVKDESIWLSQKQIEDFFDVQVPAVSKHVKNILRTKELNSEATCSKMETVQKEGSREVKRITEVFNLDMIISVGYRVNSQKATQFRIWATKTLKSYLLKGYAINEKLLREQNKRLEEIKSTILMIGEKSNVEELIGKEKELLQIITEYAKSWRVLDEFDANSLEIAKLNHQIQYEFEYTRSKKLVEEMRQELSKFGIAGDLFGCEVGFKLKSVLGCINQTFDGQDLYPSVEEKAANLLYLTIKDHPFADGNKRIGSMLFLHFLNRNEFLYRANGELKLNDNSIIALALLVASSNPKEKDNIIKLIINILQD